MAIHCWKGVAGDETDNRHCDENHGDQMVNTFFILLARVSGRQSDHSIGGHPRIVCLLRRFDRRSLYSLKQFVLLVYRPNKRLAVSRFESLRTFGVRHAWNACVYFLAR